VHARTLPDEPALIDAAVEVVSLAARDAIERRGRFTFAVSGGSTPWRLLQRLAAEPIGWRQTHVFQVDERVAPTGHAERNLTRLLKSLGRAANEATVHPMDVEDADLERAAARYAAKLRSVCGAGATLDLVHLGLGEDGHTASLAPGDAVLEITDCDVAVTAEYRGRRRVTLTYPALNRARGRLWLVAGAAKREVLGKLLRGDTAIPGGRIERRDTTLLTDQDVATVAGPLASGG